MLQMRHLISCGKDSGDTYIKVVTGAADKVAGIQFIHNNTSTNYGGDYVYRLENSNRNIGLCTGGSNQAGREYN